MANLPSDPVILLSYVNTQLRDVYPSLTALCDDADADRAEIEKKLAALGYVYDEKSNKFV